MGAPLRPAGDESRGEQEAGGVRVSILERTFPTVCFVCVSGAPPEVFSGNLNLVFAIKLLTVLPG